MTTGEEESSGSDFQFPAGFPIDFSHGKLPRSIGNYSHVTVPAHVYTAVATTLQIQLV